MQKCVVSYVFKREQNAWLLGAPPHACRVAFLHAQLGAVRAADPRRAQVHRDGGDAAHVPVEGFGVVQACSRGCQVRRRTPYIFPALCWFVSPSWGSAWALFWLLAGSFPSSLLFPTPNLHSCTLLPFSTLGRSCPFFVEHVPPCRCSSPVSSYPPTSCSCPRSFVSLWWAVRQVVEVRV